MSYMNAKTKKNFGNRRSSKQSNSTSNDSNESDMNDIFVTVDEGETMTNYYMDLPVAERSLIKNIISLDGNLK